MPAKKPAKKVLSRKSMKSIKGGDITQNKQKTTTKSADAIDGLIRG